MKELSKEKGGRLRDFESGVNADVDDDFALPTLRRRPRPTKTAEEPPVVADPAPREVPVVADTAGASKPLRPRRRDLTRASNVYLPKPISDALEARRNEVKWSAGRIIEEAIIRHHDDLRQHFAAPAPREEAVFPGFSLAGATVQRPAAKREPRVLVSYRLPESDFRALDQQVEEFGARTRTALIEAALTAYLLTDDSEGQ